MNSLLERTQSVEDSKIIRRCRDGDLGAFEELVRRYRETAMRICMGYLRNAEEAVDCSQDAFVRAFENLAQFDATKPFFPWFYRVLQNVCLKRLRRIRQHRESPLDLTEHTAGHLDGFQTDDVTDAVQQALHQLTDEQREVILLRHWENLSYEVIAGTIGQPAGTVMSRLHYARRRLSELLGGLEAL